MTSHLPSPRGGPAWPRGALSTVTAVLGGLALATTGAAQIPGQRPSPHIAYVYPAGGQQGTTLKVAVGGQNLVGASTAYFSVLDLQARVAGYERPITQREFQDAREKLQELMDKRAAARAGKKDGKSAAVTWTAADDAMVAELRLKVANPPNRQANPSMAETVTLEITIPKHAPPGEHELRVRGTSGVSNPVVFMVGQLTEFTEPLITPTTPPAEAGRQTGAGPVKIKPAREIAIPAVANGQILPGEIDRLRFAAKKGQKLTMAVYGRALIPYLADAVPGWFQPTLALFDAKGRELSYADDYRFSPDPVLLYEIPADGDYTLEIKDSIFRGREDFVYRIAIGELPFVTSIFPLGAGPGQQASFHLEGWNLSSQKLAVDTTGKGIGVYLLAVRNNAQLSNQVKFAVDGDAEAAEAEPNNAPDAAQSITAPLVVNGRIEKSGDTDFFRFNGKAGESVVAEVFARRLNSPLDSVLELMDAAGKRVAINDDHEDKRSARDTHHADSRISVTLPADGVYLLKLSDGQRAGGPEYGYRLRVGPPRPDFELRVTPSTINARGGTHVPVTMYALRRDGFDGEILLGLKDAPRGFVLSGGRIPPGQDKVMLTLWVPPMQDEEPFNLTFGGRATIAGKPVAHLAVPAEDMEQAFAYRHLVPARQLKVQVSARGAAGRVVSRTPLQVPWNGRGKVRVSLPNVRGLANVRAELPGAPNGITVASASASGEEVEVVIACDGEKVKPGTAGNLILNLYGDRDVKAAKNNSKKAQQRSYLGSLPAIPFEISGGPPPNTASAAAGGAKVSVVK